MTGPRTEVAARPRAVVIGAETPAGARVRRALEDRAVEARRVVLCGRGDEEAILSEYDGEARLVRPLDPEDLRPGDVLFLCEAGPAAIPAREFAGRGGLVLDLAGLWPGAPLVYPGKLARPADGASVPCSVPHPLAIVLAEILRPIHDACGVADVTAFILRPASDWGAAGLEELREQTLKLLRFEPPPDAVFGRQLAFNAIPQHLLPGESRGVAARIGEQAGLLAGIPGARIAPSLVAVTAFHGHALSLRVTTERGGAGETAAALRTASGIRLDDGDAEGTLLDGGETREIRVFRCAEEPAGGVWLWAVASEAMSASAEAAVAFAGEEAGL